MARSSLLGGDEARQLERASALPQWRGSSSGPGPGALPRDFPQGQAQVSLPFCLHNTPIDEIGRVQGGMAVDNTPTKSPILQVSKLRLVLMRSHGSEAAELGLQRRIWANIPHGERDCQGLGQMLASDVTSGGCPLCRALPR